MITTETMIKKVNACIESLDHKKNCLTCKHKELSFDKKPCCDCYAEILGMPVDPTKWESK